MEEALKERAVGGKAQGHSAQDCGLHARPSQGGAAGSGN